MSGDLPGRSVDPPEFRECDLGVDLDVTCHACEREGSVDDPLIEANNGTWWHRLCRENEETSRETDY